MGTCGCSSITICNSSLRPTITPALCQEGQLTFRVEAYAFSHRQLSPAPGTVWGQLRQWAPLSGPLCPAGLQSLPEVTVLAAVLVSEDPNQIEPHSPLHTAALQGAACAVGRVWCSLSGPTREETGLYSGGIPKSLWTSLCLKNLAICVCVLASSKSPYIKTMYLLNEGGGQTRARPN